MLSGVVLQVVLLLVGSCLFSQTSEATEDVHPCLRPCTDGGKPMVCRYKWVLENYLTLSRACFDCMKGPGNWSDCYREQCVTADGLQRGLRSINRQLPGPSIQVCEGDTVEVTVVNQLMLSEGVTIHWHGVLQRNSQHMDGVPMLTQCPIHTFANFTYRFQMEDPGTHLYHSHTGLLRAEGLFGGIVVRQSPSRDVQHDLYDLDLPEHVIVLADWTHKPVEEMYTIFFHSAVFESQSPDSILINGRGFYPPTRKHITSEKPIAPPAVFHVQQGKRYRFRLVNAGALRCPIQLSVDNHHLLLIASDGGPLKPVKVASILIFSGERYDFVLHADRQDKADMHWIRARGLDKCEKGAVQQFAVLRYSHDREDFPQAKMDYNATVEPDGTHFNRWFLKREEVPEPDEHKQITDMTSLEPDDESLREEPDQRFFLEFAYRLRTNYHYHDPVLYPGKGKGYKTVSSTTINNISNILPPAPILTQLDDIDPGIFCDVNTMKRNNCSYNFCECTHRLVAKEGEILEMVIYNSNHQYGYTHPLHLHGHRYRVVAADRLEKPIFRDDFERLDKKGLIHRRLHQAPLKDTVPIPNGGFLILRLKANNPGAWFMHCHVSFHAEVGMALTLQINNVDGGFPAPPPDFPRCDNWPKRRHQHNLNADASGSNVVPSSDTGETPGGGGNWMVPVLAVSVVTNVVVVVASAVYSCRAAKRSSFKVRELQPRESASDRRQAEARSGSLLSSDDENTSLI